MRGSFLDPRSSVARGVMFAPPPPASPPSTQMISSAGPTQAEAPAKKVCHFDIDDEDEDDSPTYGAVVIGGEEDEDDEEAPMHFWLCPVWMERGQEAVPLKKMNKRMTSRTSNVWAANEEDQPPVHMVGSSTWWGKLLEPVIMN